MLDLAAGLVISFAVTLHADLSPGRLTFNIAITLVGIGVIARIVIREARRRTAGTGLRLKGRHLALVLDLVLVAFPLTYYVLAVSGTDHIAGMATRIDALYVTTVTMTTVGFGDIVPVSQAAQALETLQLVFNVAFIALMAGLNKQGFQARVANASGQPRVELLRMTAANDRCRVLRGRALARVTHGLGVRIEMSPIRFARWLRFRARTAREGLAWWRFRPRPAAGTLGSVGATVAVLMAKGPQRRGLNPTGSCAGFLRAWSRGTSEQFTAVAREQAVPGRQVCRVSRRGGPMPTLSSPGHGCHRSGV